jgi:hypothetical protein
MYVVIFKADFNHPGFMEFVPGDPLEPGFIIGS